MRVTQDAYFLLLTHTKHVFLRFYTRSSASNIRTSASPRRQRSHRGLRVTQDAYFLLLTHTKQSLLVTFCETSAGIEVIIRTHGRNGRKYGQTDVEVEIVI